MTLVALRRVTLHQLLNVHRGQSLPEAMVIVVVVPLAALAFYWLVVRRQRGR